MGKILVQLIMRKKLPKGVKEQVWLKTFGKKFESKCYIRWCKNIINVYDFHVGHNVPKSKGGNDHIDNLKPICSRCNTSMGSNFTIDEWNNTFVSTNRYLCCFVCK